MSQRGRVALVTGGAGGIGAACARVMSERGWRVAVVDQNAAAAQALADSLPEPAIAVTADVTDPEATEAMVATVLERLGGLSAAVNAAGIAAVPAPIAEVTVKDWLRVMQVNLTGAFLSMRAEIPAMSEGGGSIVNISSVMGAGSFAGAGAYVASKHGLEGLTKAAALDYAESGIRINAVAPGFISTELLTKQRTEAERVALGQRHPVGRLGTSEEVAEVVAFLCSEEASFVTGSCYRVDGGYLTRGG